MESGNSDDPPVSNNASYPSTFDCESERTAAPAIPEPVPDPESQQGCPTFAPFPRLPPELRLQIWHEAAKSSHSDPRVCILTAGMVSGEQPWVVHEPVNQRLLMTSREAHAVVAQSAAVREYEPERDIVYAEEDMMVSLIRIAGADKTAAWPPRIRHLASPVGTLSVLLCLPLIMPQLTSLETISLVYPAALGMVDCRSEVEVPDRRSILRELSPAESDSGTVFSSYEHSGWGRDTSKKWEMSIGDHLRMVVEKLNAQCGAMGFTEGSTRAWDSENNRLKVAYAARAFEVPR